MADNKHYFIKKEDRMRRAIQHVGIMREQYTPEISKCVRNTTIYSANHIFLSAKSRNIKTGIKVTDSDTVNAAFKFYEGKTAILNFASYKNPGGMFLKGSSAQEESLCHASFLYNVLREMKEYYAWNKEHLNKALYLNRALYSPDIIFFNKDKVRKIDVITCAAPNYSADYKYCNVPKEENFRVFKDRIRFVLEIAAENHVDTLILGAYGCGVFGQDPSECARIFKDFLYGEFQNIFDMVCFAIIEDNKNKNLETFKKIFVRE